MSDETQRAINETQREVNEAQVTLNAAQAATNDEQSKVNDAFTAQNKKGLERLADTTEELASEVRGLTTKLDITDRVVKRGKRNQKLIALVLAIAMALVLFALWQVQQNKANAQRACENSNESRQGALLLWTTILDVPRPKSAPPRSPEEIKTAEAFRTFTKQLYQQHDCSDPSRKYPLPKVPPALLP